MTYVCAILVGISLSIAGLNVVMWQFWLVYIAASLWFISGLARGKATR